MRKRDVEKTIKEFEKLHQQGRAADFYAQEIEAIYKMSVDKWELIANAFHFAFMVGYKTGKKAGRG